LQHRKIRLSELKKGEIKMEVKKILWHTDFSSSAEKALPYVTSLTQKYQAEIHVLYVIEDIAHHESWYGDFDRTHIDKLMEWADKSANKRLEQICEKYLEGCPLYIKHIAIGDPAQEILKLIDKEKVDMVIMTSHGEQGLFRFGSKGSEVLRSKVIKHKPDENRRIRQAVASARNQ
jgi:nucleotide-binding universal stress UspA family protein